MGNELQLRTDADIPIVIEKIDRLLAVADTIPELNKVAAFAKAMQALGEKAKIGLHAKNTLTERYIDIRARRGEMLKRLKDEGKLLAGRRKDAAVTGSDSTIFLDDLGLGGMDSSRDQMLAELPVEKRRELCELCTSDAKKQKEFAMSTCLAEVARDRKAVQVEELRGREVEPPTGEYDVVVIDPPWDMQKIEREVAPNQAGFDYPTMTEEELRDLTIPMAENCHVWLWTTHRFITAAFRLLEHWNLKYVCTFVWHKPGGFQPFGLPQYNCEFALYARWGVPIFADTKDFPTCFNAPRGKHSEKPDVFFEMVKRVAPGQRISMFERKDRDGFVSWGNEA